MKSLFFILTFSLLSLLIHAQTIHNFSMGASYANGQYYNLKTGFITSVAHPSWDIAFSVYGFTDGGIFINEGSSYSSTAPKLYIIPNKNFNDVITSSDVGNQLRNDEMSWANGAFNSIRDTSSGFDYGWGAYNMNNHKIEASVLFAIELGNGSFKKLSIDTLTSGTYYFRYANFDGTDLKQKSIAKSAYPNQTLAYFSIANDSAVVAEPTTDWHWLFTRYEIDVLDSNGNPTPYTVGGILLNRKVEAVIVDGISPSTVDINNYTLTSDSLTIIGHTWKSYGFTTGWTVDTDRVYFVKTADSSLYKNQFIDFQGSSTGTGAFQKTLLGTSTAVIETEGYTALESFDLFPNPASDVANLVFSLEQAQESMQIQLVNIYGQTVLQKAIHGNSGLNGLEIYTQSLNTGSYTLILRSKDVFISKKVLIQR
ncbi:MAG: T9SS type A sorting domain-containing protein [Aureispira sp.]|nr:T9SS type A sorting domain-containing protein [Aureispira sp.]